MPALIIGAAVLVALLLSRKSEAAQREEESRLLAEQKAAADAQAKAQGEKNLAAGLGIGGTALAGGVSLVSSLLGGGGAAGGATAGAVGGATGGAAGGGSTASSVGAIAGTSVAGSAAIIAAAVVCTLANVVATGMILAKGIANIVDGAVAHDNPAILPNLYRASMRRVFDSMVQAIQSRLPAATWAQEQGKVRNIAAFVTVEIFRTINRLYEQGILNHPIAPGATFEQHRAYWASFNTFFPDYDAWANQWLGELGAGSLASVKAGAGDSEDVRLAVARAGTVGKMLFYFGALCKRSVLSVGGLEQPPWFNRWSILEPLVAALPFGMQGAGQSMGEETGFGYVNLVNTWGGLSGPDYPLRDRFEYTFEFNGHYRYSSGLFVENGLVMDFGASLATGSLSYTTEESVNAILAKYGGGATL